MCALDAREASLPFICPLIICQPETQRRDEYSDKTSNQQSDLTRDNMQDDRKGINRCLAPPTRTDQSSPYLAIYTQARQPNKREAEPSTNIRTQATYLVLHTHTNSPYIHSVSHRNPGPVSAVCSFLHASSAASKVYCTVCRTVQVQSFSTSLIKLPPSQQHPASTQLTACLSWERENQNWYPDQGACYLQESWQQNEPYQDTKPSRPRQYSSPLGRPVSVFVLSFYFYITFRPSFSILLLCSLHLSPPLLLFIFLYYSLSLRNISSVTHLSSRIAATLTAAPLSSVQKKTGASSIRSVHATF